MVMQGSVPGGVICSNQISKLSNKLFAEGDVYMYHNKIPIPPLAMVDDVAAMVECNSITALSCNIKTDTFIQRKKLEGQVGEGKCQWVHIGPNQCNSCYSINDTIISQAEAYKYLGDHVANIWKVLYEKRCEKAIGYSATCQAMALEMSLGNQLYAIAKLVHMSIFVNGTLINTETWPHFTTERVEAFERIEQNFFRKILKAHSKTPIEAIYLELGVLPLRFNIMKRRILYLQDILNRDDEELTKQVICQQKVSCYDGDFYPQVCKDMASISISEQDLKCTKQQLKNLVHDKVKTKAYQFLISKAREHSKIREEIYENGEGAAYYMDNRFTPDLVTLLFKFRTRTYLVKNNFRNNYRNTNINCPICDAQDDKQEHIFECHNILIEYSKQMTCRAEDIYSNDLDVLYDVAITLKELVHIREKLIDSN